MTSGADRHRVQLAAPYYYYYYYYSYRARVLSVRVVLRRVFLDYYCFLEASVV